MEGTDQGGPLLEEGVLVGLRGLRRAGEHLGDPVHSGASGAARMTLGQGDQESGHAGLRALGLCVLREVPWEGCASWEAR